MNKFTRQTLALLLTVGLFSASIASDEPRNHEAYIRKTPLYVIVDLKPTANVDELRNHLNRCTTLNQDVKLKLREFQPQNMSCFFEVINSCEAYKSHITGLDIFFSRLDDAGITMVVDNLPYLQRLEIYFNQITSLGFSKIMGLQNLKVLHIGHNQFTNDLGAAQVERLSTLEVLNIFMNNITDEGLDYLLRNNQMPNLRELNLANNKITYEGAKKLIGSHLFDRLFKLSLSYNEITIDEAKELSEQALKRNPKIEFLIATSLLTTATLDRRAPGLNKPVVTNETQEFNCWKELRNPSRRFQEEFYYGKSKRDSLSFQKAFNHDGELKIISEAAAVRPKVVAVIPSRIIF